MDRPIYGSFLSDIGHALGQGVSAVANVATSAASTLGHAVATGVTALPRLVDDIAHGQRVDRALAAAFQRQIGVVKDLAPYVQTVISMVPGIGTGASAAIAGGLALAQGQPITSALIAAVRGAIPGGPAAQAAFDMARGLVEGKSLAASALEAAINRLPPGVRSAAQVGAALAHGANLQKGLTHVAITDAIKNGIHPQIPAHLPVAAKFHAATMVKAATAAATAAKAGNTTAAIKLAALAKAHQLAHHAAATAVVTSTAAQRLLSNASHVVKAVELHHAPSQAYTRQLSTRQDAPAKVQLAMLDIARKSLRVSAAAHH